MAKATFYNNVNEAAIVSTGEELTADISTGEERFYASFSEETMHANMRTDEEELSAEFGMITIVTPQSDYNALFNKPRINSVPLVGDQTGDTLGLVDETDALSNEEIEAILAQADS